VQLIVNDGFVDSEPDTVIVTTLENLPPLADAGVDQSAISGVEFCLDGSSSIDPNNDPITYSWVLYAPGGSSAVLDGSLTVTPCFIPDMDGDYVVELIVNDGVFDSEPDEVVISVDTNVPPVAVAELVSGQDLSVGQPICIDGDNSYDPDNGPAAELEYFWSITGAPSGSTAGFDDDTARLTCFTTDKSGEYVVQLIVFDGEYDCTEPDTVLINVEENIISFGDLDGDGDVDYDDYLIFRTAYGSCDADPNYLSGADLDGDGCVTINDYRILRSLL